ncbi:hypothetical protein COPCOM_03398 [Coprococcus comes ATCC 27758]|uniref:Uncharacterized protein n=2 Tax=Lachnospiraceae TaxID=186803 RepID=D4LSI4_9FIRM|nr:hypothetical protein [Blautia obeum]EEG88063.1 hypothetical protein COPCOM_03398 [Coprococcus comes ATCC 27758]CBL23742.1 hypothetical protein CK5_24250 [Blautia obeum A2-162]
MKKINEQTKSFLLYGIEDVIKPKEIYKLDGAILFLVFLFFFLSESAPSPFFSKVFLVIVYLGFVILSFSRTEVTGKKVFLDHWNTKSDVFYFVLLGSNYPHADNYERRIL